VALSDDIALLERHQRGDIQAFRELFARLRGPVYGYLVRCRVADPDDLAQEIFLHVHRGLARFRPERPLKTWVFAIACNAVRSHFRRFQPALSELTDHAESPEPSAEAHAEAHETAAMLERAIGALPLPARQVLILTCLAHMEQDDVAALLEMPVNTVKTHLRRARLKLAQALALPMLEEVS
jgi:RNA polymerase sigma-70 factor (ECF subfamily)